MDYPQARIMAHGRTKVRRVAWSESAYVRHDDRKGYMVDQNDDAYRPQAEDKEALDWETFKEAQQ